MPIVHNFPTASKYSLFSRNLLFALFILCLLFVAGKVLLLLESSSASRINTSDSKNSDIESEMISKAIPRLYNLAFNRLDFLDCSFIVQASDQLNEERLTHEVCFHFPLEFVHFSHKRPKRRNLGLTSYSSKSFCRTGLFAASFRIAYLCLVLALKQQL
jgi:hypothetical protein